MVCSKRSQHMCVCVHGTASSIHRPCFISIDTPVQSIASSTCLVKVDTQPMICLDRTRSKGMRSSKHGGQHPIHRHPQWRSQLILTEPVRVSAIPLPHAGSHVCARIESIRAHLCLSFMIPKRHPGAHSCLPTTALVAPPTSQQALRA